MKTPITRDDQNIVPGYNEWHKNRVKIAAGHKTKAETPCRSQSMKKYMHTLDGEPAFAES